MDKKDVKTDDEKQSSAGSLVAAIFAILFIVVVFGGCVKACSVMSEPTHYKSINDATEDELADFLEWDSKQKK